MYKRQPCGGGKATINTEIESNATLEWKLKKVKKIQTSGTMTVSYTHLDVYKRQMYQNILKKEYADVKNSYTDYYRVAELNRLLVNSLPAVSYTHLDVYKRQILKLPRLHQT